MDWEIHHPELEFAYTNGRSEKLPILTDRIAKKITIRIKQIEAVAGFNELKKIKSWQLRKITGPNRYTVYIDPAVRLLIEVVKQNDDSLESIHIIDIHQ